MPTGTFQARIVQTWVNTPDGGAPYVLIKATIPDTGPETIFIRIYISDKAIRYARKQLRMIGFDIDTRDVFELERNHQTLAGTEFEAVGAEETYNGKTEVKWKVATEDAPITEDLAKTLTEKLRAAKSKDGEAKVGEKKPRAPRRTGPSQIEQEIADHMADAEAHKDDKDPF